MVSEPLTCLKMAEQSPFLYTPEQNASDISAPFTDTGNSSTVQITSLQPVNPRLTEENYHYWRAQVLNSVAAHDLEDHLTGLITCPPPFILVKTDSSPGGVKQKNPQYTLWKKHDRFLMS